MIHTAIQVILVDHLARLVGVTALSRVKRVIGRDVDNIPKIILTWLSIPTSCKLRGHDVT
jgi:hypothetical protein